MLRLQRITTKDVALYNYMEQLLTLSFPEEEYRPLEELRHYIDHKPHYYNNIIFQNDTPIGFITYWDFNGFYYAEHFAIDPAQRNGGHGKNVLTLLFEVLNQQPLVLEVESPEEEMAIRRINFYKRQGLVLWEKQTYRQPPYRAGGDFLPMLLMAYGDLNPDKDFELVRERIYREIYNAEV